jgi:lysophospholipase L1-like esterase
MTFLGGWKDFAVADSQTLPAQLSSTPQFIPCFDRRLFFTDGYWQDYQNTNTRSGRVRVPLIKERDSVQRHQPGRSVRFRTNSTFVNLITYGWGNGVEVWVDGVVQPLVITPNNRQHQQRVQLVSGLNAVAFHEIQIVAQTNNQLGVPDKFDFDGIEISADATILPTNFPSYGRNRVLVFGDSITAGTGAGRESASYARQLATMLGMQLVNQGIGGSRVTTGNPNAGADRVSSDVVNIGADLVFILYGTNDMSSGVSLDAFQNSYESMLATIKKGLPHTRVIAGTCVWRKDPGAKPSLVELNKAIQAACRNQEVPCVDGYGAFNSVAYLTADNVHPNAEGHQAIACHLAPQIQSVLYH